MNWPAQPCSGVIHNVPWAYWSHLYFWKNNFETTFLIYSRARSWHIFKIRIFTIFLLASDLKIRSSVSLSIMLYHQIPSKIWSVPSVWLLCTDTILIRDLTTWLQNLWVLPKKKHASSVPAVVFNCHFFRDQFQIQMFSSLETSDLRIFLIFWTKIDFSVRIWIWSLCYKGTDQKIETRSNEKLGWLDVNI